MKFILILLAFHFLATSQSCNKDSMPGCIKAMTERTTDQPIRIDEYEYKGKKTFLATADCCDQYNTLYDENCTPICSPSGGLDGQGDRKCTDFETSAKFIRKVWEKTP